MRLSAAQCHLGPLSGWSLSDFSGRIHLFPAAERLAGAASFAGRGVVNGRTGGVRR